MATPKGTKAVVMPTDEADRLRRRVVLQMIPRWKSWTDTPAWLVSTAFHALIFILLALFWQPTERGTGGSVDRPIGIAVVHSTPSGDEYDLQSAESNAASGSAAAASLPPGDGPPVDMESLLAGLGGNDTDKGTTATEGNGTAVANQGTGARPDGRGKGLKTTTSVYGITGEGSSFVYVFDRSDSMNGYGGGPLRSAKREMIQSLESLKSVNQFQIVFYNETPTPFQSRKSGSQSLLDATDIEKEFAIRFVENIKGFGGTEHIGALRMGLRYAPDVVFFLTDAAEPSLSQTQLDSIQKLCERAGTTIHTIEFGTGPSPGSGRWIEVLALMTNGKYRYVDVKQLASPN
jgi:hypothetical protein